MSIIQATSRAAVLAVAALFTAGGATDAAAKALKLDCECTKFSGGDTCHAFLTIAKGKLSFGAFETSGSGRLKVGTFRGKPLYSSTIRTVSGSKMRVFAYVPAGVAKVRVNTDKFSPAKPEFLMRCK